MWSNVRRFMKNNNNINEINRDEIKDIDSNVKVESSSVHNEDVTNADTMTTAELESECIDINANGTATKKRMSIGSNKFIAAIRPALMCLVILTIICGVLYPIGVTLVGQTVFPYEANGSQITVTLADGTQKVYGSELIGQAYENPKYLFGRVNTGAPTNLSPESEEYKALLEARIADRRAKLAAIGYTDESVIPDELITSSGSGVDPHISPDTAYAQIPIIVAARTLAGDDITEAEVREVIDKYTEGRFLGIFGSKSVNVLLVNLALDGLL